MADGHDDHGGGHGGGHKADHGGSKGGGGKGGEKAGTAIAVVAVVGYILWAAISSLLGLNPPSSSFRNVSAVSMNDVVANQCNGILRQVELESSATVLNPGAICSLTFTILEGAVEFDGPFGSVVMRPNETQDLSQYWFETVRAVDGHAVLSYQLTQ